MRRLSSLAVFMLCLLIAIPRAANADLYRFGPKQTDILFYIKRLLLSDMVGHFSRFNGTFKFNDRTPSIGDVNVAIESAGAFTASDMINHELQGEDFFDSGHYPIISFRSKGAHIIETNNASVEGNVTLRGITRPGVLHIVLKKVEYDPLIHTSTARFSASMTLKRSEFGMTSLFSAGRRRCAH